MEKLNLKFIGIILVWVAAVGAILYFVPFKKIVSPGAKIDSQKQETVNAKLTAGHYEYNFGTISMANGKVRHTYQLKNEGPDALDISKVWTSCMCTSAEVKMANGKTYGPFGMPGHSHGEHSGSNTTNISVPPGEEFELTAEFDPNAHGPDATGPIQRVIYIKANSSSEPLGLSFSGEVVK